jgi:chromosome segregation ATPase
VLALRETIKGVELKQETAQLEQTQALAGQRESLERGLQHLEADLNGKAEALKNAEAQLVALQAVQQKSASSNRLAFAAVACLALASLGWQIAQHFALI